jgi:hypothetical protein
MKCDGCHEQLEEVGLQLCPKCAAALPPVRSEPLLARADVFDGRAHQCSEIAVWMDLNGMADSADHLRNAAAILRHTADKYRANAHALPDERG